MNMFKAFGLVVGCTLMGGIVGQTFVTSSKKIPTLRVQDCVEDTLQESTSLAKILGYMGKTLTHISSITQRKAQFAQEVVDDDRQGVIKRANKTQRHEFVGEQKKFDQRLQSLLKRFEEDLASFDRLAHEYDAYLNQFEKEVCTVTQKTA